MGMDAQFAPAQLVARCLLPGCRRAGPVAAEQFTQAELRLPHAALGPKLRCSCGSRQVCVEPWSSGVEAVAPTTFYRWYA